MARELSPEEQARIEQMQQETFGRDPNAAKTRATEILADVGEATTLKKAAERAKRDQSR